MGNSSTISDDELLEYFDIECKSAARAELQMWRAHFKEKEILPDSPHSSLIHANPMIFPNIRKMLIYIMSLLVRLTFSTLRRIKTYLRTTISNKRLNGLALLSVCIYTINRRNKGRVFKEEASFNGINTILDFFSYSCLLHCL